jgi:hypothetical protein
VAFGTLLVFSRSPFHLGLTAMQILPDNPEFGPVQSLKNLLQAIENFKWTIPEVKADVYLNLLSLLAAYAQPKYITSLPNGLSLIISRIDSHRFSRFQ